jgi:group I intron endonuclease
MIVYLITNRVNGKRYVGQSEVELETRWKWHVTSSRCPSSAGYQKMAIVRAIAKHGPDAFDRQVIEECSTQEELDAAEIRWIAELGTFGKAGYNLTMGGHGIKGYRHTEDTKRRMSESRKGKKMPEGHRLRLIEYNRNRVVSEETREKMRLARTGIGHSLEACTKISEALCKRVRKTKQVSQKSDGAIVAIFSSAKEAAIAVNGNVNHIRECCLGTTNRRTHRGYDWSYTE